MSITQSQSPRAHIVFCHPEPQSFNGTLQSDITHELSRKGYITTNSDLYGKQFNPIDTPDIFSSRANEHEFSILAEQRHAWRESRYPTDVLEELKPLYQADLVVFQFPLWWHSIPALLKGWFDRVFVNGGVYSSDVRYDRGVFQHKRAICSVTSGAPQSTFVDGGRAGGTIETLLHPVNYSLHYVGFSVLRPILTAGIQGHGYAYLDDHVYQGYLQTARQRVQETFREIEAREALDYPGWSDFVEAESVPKHNRRCLSNS